MIQVELFIVRRKKIENSFVQVFKNNKSLTDYIKEYNATYKDAGYKIIPADDIIKFNAVHG